MDLKLSTVNRRASPKVTDLHRHDEQGELRKRFVDARKASGLSQEEAATAVGMSGSSVARKERGEQVITKRDVAAMEQLVRDRRTGTVPRGTSEGNHSAQRFAWNRVVNGESVRAYLSSLRDDLHALGATADEEDEAVRSVRESGAQAYNAERLDWTEDEAIQVMEVPADGLRRYFAGLKRRRPPESE